MGRIFVDQDVNVSCCSKFLYYSKHRCSRSAISCMYHQSDLTSRLDLPRLGRKSTRPSDVVSSQPISPRPQPGAGLLDWTDSMQGQQSASSSHATPGPIRGPFSNQSPPVPPSQSQHPCPPTHPAQPPQQSTSRRESYGAPPVASTSAAAAGPPASSLSPDWTAAQIDAEKNSIISLLQSVAATGQGCASLLYFQSAFFDGGRTTQQDPDRC